MGMNAMEGMPGAADKVNPILKLYMELAPWQQTLAKILVVFCAAAIIGLILGKLYASVRYPDPDKNSAVSPRMRVLFLVVLLLCGIWLYKTMTKVDEPAEEVSGGELSSGEAVDGYAPSGGGGGGIVRRGGAVTMAVG